jgi:hypothetical protein
MWDNVPMTTDDTTTDDDQVNTPGFPIIPTEELMELEVPPMTGWVVHTAENKPASTAGRPIWAWCKVSQDGPGYSEIVFTEADGTTPVDPYPVQRNDAGDALEAERRVQLGPVVFQVFC